jgi:transcriptional regulator with GAF, ATPase, and Fis domain
LPRRPAATAILGTSPALQRALAAVDRVARTEASVVLHGESGTGKELFARELHARSGRPGAFVAVNCAAIPEALLESQLFGHKRGSFTGAAEAGKGLVVAASGGTLFLDEVGELSLDAQAKLLRVLEQRAVLAVGDTEERAVDLRVVAATHRDIKQLVAARTFREDLWYRLCEYPIELPPLRSRGRDVVAIARGLLAGGLRGAPSRALGRCAERTLLGHNWPGNVRELRNVLLRASLDAAGPTITAEDLCRVLGVVVAPPPEPVAQRVLAMLSEDIGIGAAELAVAVDLPRTNLKRLLGALVDAGDVRVVGVGKATRYLRPAAAPVCADPRQAAALAIVTREGRVTRSRLAAEAGLPERTAGRVLAEMVEAGVLRADGRRGNAAGYVLVLLGGLRG